MSRICVLFQSLRAVARQHRPHKLPHLRPQRLPQRKYVALSPVMPALGFWWEVLSDMGRTSYALAVLVGAVPHQ